MGSDPDLSECGLQKIYANMDNFLGADIKKWNPLNKYHDNMVEPVLIYLNSSRWEVSILKF